MFTTNRQGEPDTTSWFKIWEAANAIYYGCIVHGLKGTFRGLGNQDPWIITISMTLMGGLGDNNDLFLNFIGP